MFKILCTGTLFKFSQAFCDWSEKLYSVSLLSFIIQVWYVFNLVEYIVYIN